MTNSRFSVAIHILALVMREQQNPLSSEMIASSVNTSPVVIRRIGSLLKKAGILKSQAGKTGYELTRHPADISLLEVYKAVQTREEIFAVHPRPNPKCPVGSKIQATLDDIFTSAQKAMEERLNSMTLHDVALRHMQD